jgi:hypothetical protein
MMNGKQRVETQLEAQLIRLNTLVRERRKQLARLEKCPNKDCPCRFVWREHVEKNLAGQVGEIRRRVMDKQAKLTQSKAPAKRRSVGGDQRRSVGAHRKA